MSAYSDHPILSSAGIYAVTEFCYHGFPWVPEDHYIEMTLKKEDEVVRLRFDRPRQLQISEGFPPQDGLFISDISSRQLDDVRIEVGDYENSSISFFAANVSKLPF